ncbi:geranylgeranyl pyrophosphate synthetase, putative [Brugia malayi]|uniref:Pre-mRNA-splicing factor 18 n=1 Tax=Brugia malayi TaxID=6279 RepID=A0A0H5S2F8_BRUMA|nr:geranylgeranyl pyrophosphate synthetase, putative [Brugia malayi]CRZ22679.1 Bm3756, isoform a [Brugia malayi]VIO87614.1 geranylgeranyl pyrophosphate synthetase, putative [Brugia malayi]
MDILRAEIERKRKQFEGIQAPNKKYLKRSQLLQKGEEKNREYHQAKPLAPTPVTAAKSGGLARIENQTKEMFTEPGLDCVDLPRVDVIKRLRSRSQPITLFGETEQESRARLRKLEIEQPDMKEGWKNDFQSAMKEVDHELIEEVIKGEQYNAGKHDVAMPNSAGDNNWERIEANAELLGEGDNPNRDCDVIREFFSYILTRWGKALNARDEVEKRSAEGKLAATMHKQTMEHLRPLMKNLEKHNVNADIREHLIKICRLIIIDRDYIRANNAYMEMAIGNAPWPVGVTRSGLHQRPGSAKAYVSNIAHVLNDETQRKYIQAFKRIMTRCQKYFPTDPSKCVEYVREIETALFSTQLSFLCEMADDVAQLLAPYQYILKLPGKQLRSQLAKAFNFWLQVDVEVLDSIMTVVEMLHNASLMIDDIEDSSLLRRGLPVTHSIYGIARTINTANYVYFAALSRCILLGKFEAVEIFTEQLLELHRGQGKELYWRDIVQCPTEEEYEQMAMQKTGGLFALTVQLMELFGKKQYDFKSLIKNLAIYFQIRDDYINLCSRTYAEQKTFAEDLTEGKFSFPIIVAVDKKYNDDEIINILRQRPKDVEVKKYCIRIIEERGAFGYTLKRLQELHDLLISHIDMLGGNKELKILIETLHEDIQPMRKVGNMKMSNGK